MKDLSRLGRSLGRTVLVDNDPFSGLLQPCNLLPTHAYYGESTDRWAQHAALYMCAMYTGSAATVVQGCSGCRCLHMALGSHRDVRQWRPNHTALSGHATAAHGTLICGTHIRLCPPVQLETPELQYGAGCCCQLSCRT